MESAQLLEFHSQFNRRMFLTLSAAAATGWILQRQLFGQSGVRKLPVSGTPNPNFEPFDSLMMSFIEEHKVPGASLAVTRNGKLVYARGFGYSDLDSKEVVQPNSLFRIASVSKPITGVAIMQLVEKKKLKLDDKVVERMKLSAFLQPGAKLDERWQQVTIRQCLQHTGGWDRDKSYDPIIRPWDIAKSLNITPPVTPDHIVRYMMGQPLDFDPGERYAYSNLGYLVLGRIIEAVTGQDYESYVKQQVLAPLKIKEMQLGRALVENRAKGEVRYYDSEKRTGRALFPPRLGEQVPLQDGALNVEGFEAHGGWIASAVDLVKFAAAFDIPAKCPILEAKTIQEMWARPNGAAGNDPSGKPKDAFYGCGWSVRPVGNAGKVNTWHAGLIAGTESLLVRRWDGTNWAVLFNTANAPDGKPLAGLSDEGLHKAADKVKDWPTSDHFNKFLK